MGTLIKLLESIFIMNKFINAVPWGHLWCCLSWFKSTSARTEKMGRGTGKKQGQRSWMIDLMERILSITSSGHDDTYLTNMFWMPWNYQAIPDLRQPRQRFGVPRFIDFSVSLRQWLVLQWEGKATDWGAKCLGMLKDYSGCLSFLEVEDYSL